MSDFDFSICSDNVKVLFVNYRKMDVLLKKHRNGADVMDYDDIERLKVKRKHYHDVMIILGLIDEYRIWLDEMGIE